MTARTCPIDGAPIAGLAKYCSSGCANEARRRWHESHPGGNRPTRQQPLAAPPPPLCALPGCDKPARPGARARYCSPAHADEARLSQLAERKRKRRTATFELRAAAPRPRRSNSPGRTAALKSAQQQKTRRERERELAQQQQVAEERRQEVVRPRFRLVFDPRIVIRPGRPAPTKRYTNGVPCEFQDDLDAIADHGSPRLAMPPPTAGYAPMSALTGVG